MGTPSVGEDIVYALLKNRGWVSSGSGVAASISVSVSCSASRALLYYCLNWSDFVGLPHESGIYMIKNLVNNRCYIGQSQDMKTRTALHVCLLRNNKHYNKHLQNAWNKYGETAFEISVVECCGLDELDEKEILYIRTNSAFEEGYNETEGGDGLRGYTMSDDSRRRMRESHADFALGNHPQAIPVVLLNTGEQFDCVVNAAEKYDVCKADISKNAKRKSLSAGSYNGERLVWAYKSDYDAMTQEEVDILIHRAQNRKGKYCHRSKRVICLTTGKVFDSITDAALWCGVCDAVVSDTCHGKQKHGGHHPETGEALRWAFYTDTLKI